MASFISIIISILVKLLPSLLEWFAKEAAKPDKQLADDTPAPKATRDWFADKVRSHPGFKAHMEKKEHDANE